MTYPKEFIVSNNLTIRRVVVTTCTAILFTLAAVAGASDADPAPRIMVTGEGTADVAPDMAVLTLSVLREAKTARAALSANSEAMSKVQSAMASLGIADRDLQTSNFSIDPRYTYPPRQGTGAGEAPKLVGYKVRNGLTVRVRDISKVGEVLDTAVTLGVNEGGSILFTNDDPADAIAQARVAAMQQALEKAETLAGAAGVKVGKVLEISEQSYNPRPMPMMRAAVAARSEADAVPIAAGENTYKVTVNVSLAIDQ
jgi:uncharacterized protein